MERRVWTPAVGLALVAVASAVFSEHPLAQRLSVAERAAVLILDAPAAANEVWPGFSLPNRDWLIYTPDGVYLHTRRTPPSSFTPRGRVFFRAGTLSNLDGTFALAYPLDHLTVTAVPVKATPELTAEFLYHEAFHQFQHEAFTLPSDAGRHLPAESLTPAVAADIEIERRLLRDAVLGDPADERWLRRAAAVRQRRRAAGPPLLVELERIAERSEGLADYVEQRSLARARGQPEKVAVEEMGRRLKVPLRTMNGSADERLIHWRSYGTGAALATMLDRTGREWKTRALTEPLDLLLDEHVRVPPAEADRLAADARRDYGFDSLAASRNPPWGALVGMTEKEFAALGAYQLVLELAPGASIAWNLRASSSNTSGMHRPSPDVLLLPALTRLTVRAPGLEATIGRRPVRLDSPATPGGASKVTILLPAAPRLGKRPISLPLETVVTDVLIEADDVAVTVIGSALLFGDATSLRVVPVRSPQ